MWRADRYDDHEIDEPETARGGPLPSSISVGDPTVLPMNVAAPTWERWRSRPGRARWPQRAAALWRRPAWPHRARNEPPGWSRAFHCGQSHVAQQPRARPNLALRTARVAAERIVDKGLELSSVRGIDAVALGIGMVEWNHHGIDYRAPLLLRPLALRRRGRDVELTLRGRVRLNPALARNACRAVLAAPRRGGRSSRSLTMATPSKPNPPLDRLRGLTAHLEGFTITPRLVVSTFAEVGAPMAAGCARACAPRARRARGQHERALGCAGGHRDRRIRSRLTSVGARDRLIALDRGSAEQVSRSMGGRSRVRARPSVVNPTPAPRRPSGGSTADRGVNGPRLLLRRCRNKAAFFRP